MVNGYCIGGGFTQMLCCDFAIAADEALFGLSEVNWGILPGGLVSKKLTDTLLFRHAMYYACTGRTLDGRRAAEIGLANRILAARPPQGGDRRARPRADGEKPGSTARDQAGDPRGAQDGRRPGVRLPRRQGRRRSSSATARTPTPTASSSSSTTRATSRPTAPATASGRSGTTRPLSREKFAPLSVDYGDALGCGCGGQFPIQGGQTVSPA